MHQQTLVDQRATDFITPRNEWTPGDHVLFFIRNRARFIREVQFFRVVGQKDVTHRYTRLDLGNTVREVNPRATATDHFSQPGDMNGLHEWGDQTSGLRKSDL